MQFSQIIFYINIIFWINARIYFGIKINTYALYNNLLNDKEHLKPIQHSGFSSILILSINVR